MYGWIFRIIPGPTWFKVLLAIAAFLGITWLLFEYGFPWVTEHFHLNDANVG